MDDFSSEKDTFFYDPLIQEPILGSCADRKGGTLLPLSTFGMWKAKKNEKK